MERVGRVLLSVVPPVFIASILWPALVVSLIAVVLVALLVPEVHLLGLLEGLLDVLILDALGGGRPLGAPLDHCLGIDPSPWLMPLQNAVIRSLLSGNAVPFPVLVHGVVHGGSFVGRCGGGGGVLLQASVGVVFAAESLHFLGALRVDIVLEAAFVGLVHSNVKIILSMAHLNEVESKAHIGSEMMDLPQDDESLVPALNDLPEFQETDESFGLLAKEEVLDLVVVSCSSDEAAKAFDIFVAEAVLVEQEKETVFSGIEVVFLLLHCGQSWLFLLEKRRVTDDKRNGLLLPNVGVKYRFFLLL